MTSGRALLCGGIAVFVVGALAAVVVNAVDASGAVGALVFIGVVAFAGLLGGEIALRRPTPRSHR